MRAEIADLGAFPTDRKGGTDRLKVRGPATVAGQRVRIHVRTPGGFWRVVAYLPPLPPEQLGDPAFLHEHGCDQMQGFHFDAPLG